MKMRLLAIVLTSVAISAQLLAGPRTKEWEEVDLLLAHKLPAMAMERLDRIAAAARTDGAPAEATRAILQRITIDPALDGLPARIKQLETEVKKAPAAVQPVMEAILACWYWGYFQENRWKIDQRTTVAGEEGPDLETWSRSRLLAEIDRHFMTALDAEGLKTTPVAEYNDLLKAGTVPDDYRPTLYDVLAQQALAFYRTGEVDATLSEDEFEIADTDPIFADTDTFLKWQPATTDTASPKYKTIRLYQDLLRFHAHDAQRTALLDIDFERIEYGHNVAEGDRKDERYLTALRQFFATAEKFEVGNRALAAEARTLQEQGKLVEACAAAARGGEVYPTSPGAEMCRKIIFEIKTPSVDLKCDGVWNQSSSTIDVTYRNITKVYFRAVPMDFVGWVNQAKNRRPSDEAELAVLLRDEPALEWSADLPATADFKERTARLPAPVSLKAGYYLIIASGDEKFTTYDNQISATPVWVSTLALVLRDEGSTGEHDGFVLDARSGEPIADATVKIFHRSERQNQPSVQVVTTDRDGRFSFSLERERFWLLAEHGGQAVATRREGFSGWSPPEAPDHSVLWFLDRAIYRPGQTIDYKGIVTHYDQHAGDYGVKARYDVMVVFEDAQGQEIARTACRTNDYGSFSGTFTAPRDRLPGIMRIKTLEKFDQPAILRVEEYKRPKFEVKLETPAEPARLDGRVKIVGRATAYTGAAIGGARAKWHVERQPSVPPWCWWIATSAKAMAHAVATTAPDGSFAVEFVAEPDRAIAVADEPTFSFKITAEVTDSTGETRTDERTIVLGYAALRAKLSSEEWLTPGRPVTLKVQTTSLDGDPLPAPGKVTVYALQQPATIEREGAEENERVSPDQPGARPRRVDPEDPATWELGATVASRSFTNDKQGTSELEVSLPAGVYRAIVEANDAAGRKVSDQQTLEVIDPRARHYTVKLAHRFVVQEETLDPGEEMLALWGTGYERGRAYVEVKCGGQRLQSYWTDPERTLVPIKQRVTEEMRGGFTMRITYVRENRFYPDEKTIDVPWSNKELSVRWERFRSKLVPGQKETWSLVLSGPKAKAAAAEMVATLYDASLDQFVAQVWPRSAGVFREEREGLNVDFPNDPSGFMILHRWPDWPGSAPAWTYRELRDEFFPVRVGGGFAFVDVGGGEETIMLSPFEVQNADAPGYFATNALAGTRLRTKLKAVASNVSVFDAGEIRGFSPKFMAPDDVFDANAPDQKRRLDAVVARRALQETAFFYPQLRTDENGVVKLEFTAPEALTTWRFLAFAHDKQLRAGWLTDKAVTSKDLMVEPNPPRFVREGDAIEFTVKVSNLSDQPQRGTVRLTLADAESLQPNDAALGNKAPEQAFTLPAHSSRAFGWRLTVPDGTGFLTYKAVAASEQFSDGEEGFLPVLSRRVLVTESLPLAVRGKTTRAFEFKKLVESGSSDTRRNQSLTVQMVSQPAWYAVMALPYLMEFPHECSEQVFERYYANTLARHLANSDPKIRRVFEQWKNAPAPESPLNKNQDLKAVMIEETPWLNDARNETQARRNVARLFEANRTQADAAEALKKLGERQGADGLWAWFPGGPTNEYISLDIVAGFGRLRHLGAEVDMSPAVKALDALDALVDREYRERLERGKPDEYVPTSRDALYLYARSFFLKDRPVDAKYRKAVDDLLARAKAHWAKLPWRQSEAHLALALQRFGDLTTAQAIVKSLKERSVADDELGRYWRDESVGWWWWQAPIETQALMIEAFDEVAHDTSAVEECKVWLLKQKQTQAWPTTKSTADAVYALLLHGENLLASDARVEVSLGGVPIAPEKVEAGTGFYEQRFAGPAIKPEMGHITVKKTDDGVSWGAVHWQYLENIEKIAPHTGTPLQVKKTLWIRETTAHGPVLKPVNGPVAVGDELVVRLELRTDRDLEFVHLEDQRGSGTEPVDVLSRYRWQDGLGYYQTTRDTATHFFIDYLHSGTYVFEYAVRVQLRGRYQMGLAEIQCMYAPEFNSHSESLPLIVE